MTNAQADSLCAALRAQKVSYRVWERAANTDDWYVAADSPTYFTAQQILNLANQHGVAAHTNRAEFR